eukprot:1762072-Lingulodinium_polyedra.AAC.1
MQQAGPPTDGELLAKAEGLLFLARETQSGFEDAKYALLTRRRFCRGGSLLCPGAAPPRSL